MKISILIPSRGNPKGLIAVIGALKELSSRKHEIDFWVTLDSDDTVTKKDELKPFFDLFDVHLIISERSQSMGAMMNNMARQVPKTDCYIPMSDRMMCLTPGWDDIIGTALQKRDDCVYWWDNEGGTVFAILPARWYKAAGQIFTEYFPFWFDDTWLAELNILVHGLPHIPLPVKCYMQRSTRTKRCRELSFWGEFFIQSRPERMEHAMRIAAALDVPMKYDLAVSNLFERFDEHWRSNCKQMEASFFDPSEPDASYLKAKEKVTKRLDHLKKFMGRDL